MRVESFLAVGDSRARAGTGATRACSCTGWSGEEVGEAAAVVVADVGVLGDDGGEELLAAESLSLMKSLADTGGEGGDCSIESACSRSLSSTACE